MSTINLRSTRVPKDAYEELSYIESTHFGGQYIDTGVVLSSSYKYEVKFNPSTSTGCIMGNQSDATMLYRWTEELQLVYIGYYGVLVDYPIDSVKQLEYSSNNGSRTLSIDGSLLHSWTAEERTHTDTVKLFANTGYIPGDNGEGKMYYCKIWDNGTLIRDLVPARKKSTNEVGMYDTVTCTFFTNAGSGTFTAGEVIPTVSEITLQHLPAGYTKLDYIESSGTQYIDTGVSGFNTSTDKLVLQTDKPTASGYQGIVGARNTGKEGIYFSGNSLNYFTLCGSYSNEDVFNWPTELPATKIIFKAENNKTYLNDIELRHYVTPTTTTANYSITLFAARTGVDTMEWGSVKMYYCKIWDDGTLVRDLIPAKRDSDSAIGMYDLVTKTFFENAGTGTFTAGAETSNPNDIQQLSLNNNIIWTKAPEIPSIYTQKSYIESTGRQYIDTGFKPNNLTTMETVTSLSTPFIVGCCRWSGSPTYDTFGQYSLDNSLVSYYGNFSDNKYLFSYDYVDNKKIKWIIAPTKITINSVDDSSYSISEDIVQDTYQSSQNLWLFTFNNEGSILTQDATGRIYYCKLYDNGTLVRDFIPAVRNSDSEVGMYDKVTDTFYTNAGTGSFTAG